MATAQEKAIAEEAKNLWWLLLIEGLASILIGWWLLSRPITTVLTLVVFLGFYWLIAGIVDVIVAIFDRDAESRGWKLIGGIVGIIAGMVVLENKLFAGVLVPTTFLYIIAFTFIINGIIKVFVGNRSTDGHERSWGSFFTGLFYVVFGVVLLGMPLIASLASLVFASGMLAIFGGIVMVVLGFQTRGLAKEMSK